jgi:cytochrome P450
LFEAGLGTGSLASEGETWWRHRRVAAPAIDHRAIMPDVPEMIAVTERAAAQLAARTTGEVIDLEAVIGELLIELWNHVVTGGCPEAVPMLRGLAKFPRKPRLADFTPFGRWIEPLRPPDKWARDIDAYNALLHRLIAERSAPDYPGQRDLIWRLIHGRDRKSGEQLTAAEVRDEAASVIAGGVSPTVRALTWIWYLLALHPDAEAKLHAELDAVLQGRSLLSEQLPQLVYTRRTIDETMRLYPPIPAIVREAAAPDMVCGHRVPRRGVIAILPWVVHRHRRLWPNPDLFDPDRFAPENSAERPRFAYIPFASGPRVCVGAAFAITQMLVVVATLARHFRFRLAEGHPVKPVGRISLHPQGGLQVTVERRSA